LIITTAIKHIECHAELRLACPVLDTGFTPYSIRWYQGRFWIPVFTGMTTKNPGLLSGAEWRSRSWFHRGDGAEWRLWHIILLPEQQDIVWKRSAAPYRGTCYPD